MQGILSSFFYKVSVTHVLFVLHSTAYSCKPALPLKLQPCMDSAGCSQLCSHRAVILLIAALIPVRANSKLLVLLACGIL